MFSGGVGQINNNHVQKIPPKKDMLVVKIGGPAFKIGFGGGAASSRDQNTQNHLDDMNAVQRGDAEMENRLNRLIRTCIELDDRNPIQNINDQGAGGTANVTKEIVYPNGADIYLDNIISSDLSMSPLELWISEYQENNTILIDQEDWNLLEQIAQRENVPMSVIGKINDSQKITVYNNDEVVMDLPLEPVVGNSMPAKTYKIDRVDNNLPPFHLDSTLDQNILSLVKQVLSLPTVGSKRFLTNKVDRSVTGLIAGQQCVGHLHTPLSNYSITAQSHYNLTGCVTSIGEQPIKSLVNPEKMARMALGEMITNMIFAKITNLSDIRFSANWMWPLNFEGEKYNLYVACRAMCQMAKELTIAADRGKDSLSMSYKDHRQNKTIKCPPSLVVTGYAPTTDIRMRISPYFKKYNSHIYYLSFNNQFRLGCSQLAYICGQIGNDADCPDLENIQQLKYTFATIQQLIRHGKILSGHDVSDGGVIGALCEMAFAGDMGFCVKLPHIDSIDSVNSVNFLFNEELGLVMEVDNTYRTEIEELFCDYLYYLGTTIDEDKIIIDNVFSEKMTVLRMCWEKPSYEFEKLQRNPLCVECVEEEYDFYKGRHQNIPYKMYQENRCNITLPSLITEGRKHKIAIIRDEGTNGDRELAVAFYMAGFDVYDLCINDFLTNPDLTLNSFRGIAFAGGFSYSDVFGAGQGWATIIKTNEHICNIFNDFRNRPDTFSLGVCNGAQLMCLLGWIPYCQLTNNRSNKFESRCPFVKINKTNSIMLKNMEDQMLPIWIAHGEGQFIIQDNTEVPIQYVDNLGNATIKYPFNPNGSSNGVAAISSIDGRHLAMMPHPERCVLNWQIPYETNNKELYSLWMQMFVNAYEWCNTSNLIENIEK
ncbi:MAG: putative phosphoribosylformylglycinamidine synthase-like [Homavirus sp.]|uniref:Putative phosphoribosylformylglycinamidine synthase-like n=1 Tax=Homavirus sp. TaxID=2487769 RepID=A0A3G5A7V5_9VIRU|nr:MAG: putative phosphoribosylformylglycinamidine synthase-like [Homavirus sp.]